MAAKKKKATSGPKRLTPRQQLFVLEYLKDFNATRAAIRAGYSEKTAQEQGSRLLSNVMVRAAVDEAKSRMLDDIGVDVVRILREYARIAFADIRDLVSWDEEGHVTFTPSGDLTDEMASTVAKVSQTTTVIPQKNAEPIERKTMEVKQFDKMRALEKLFEYHDLAGSAGRSQGQKSPLALLAEVIARSRENRDKRG